MVCVAAEAPRYCGGRPELAALGVICWRHCQLTMNVSDRRVIGEDKGLVFASRPSPAGKGPMPSQRKALDLPGASVICGVKPAAVLS